MRPPGVCCAHGENRGQLMDEYPLRGRLADECGAFGPFSGRFRLKRSDFSIQCDQFPARHPQFGQRERGVQCASQVHSNAP